MKMKMVKIIAAAAALTIPLCAFSSCGDKTQYSGKLQTYSIATQQTTTKDSSEKDSSSKASTTKKTIHPGTCLYTASAVLSVRSQKLIFTPPGR